MFKLLLFWVCVSMCLVVCLLLLFLYIIYCWFPSLLVFFLGVSLFTWFRWCRLLFLFVCVCVCGMFVCFVFFYVALFMLLCSLCLFMFVVIYMLYIYIYIVMVSICFIIVYFVCCLMRWFAYIFDLYLCVSCLLFYVLPL